MVIDFHQRGFRISGEGESFNRASLLNKSYFLRDWNCSAKSAVQFAPCKLRKNHCTWIAASPAICWMQNQTLKDIQPFRWHWMDPNTNPSPPGAERFTFLPGQFNQWFLINDAHRLRCHILRHIRPAKRPARAGCYVHTKSEPPPSRIVCCITSIHWGLRNDIDSFSITFYAIDRDNMYTSRPDLLKYSSCAVIRLPCLPHRPSTTRTSRVLRSIVVVRSPRQNWRL